MRAKLVVVGLALAACGRDPRIVVEQDGRDDLSQGRVDASFCRGAPAAVPMPPVACSTAGAPTTLALGVCGDLRGDNTLTIQSSDRRALLAVNGTTTSASPLQVQGSLTSYGTIDARNTQSIDGTVSTAGDWLVSSPVQAKGDAFVGGMVDARNTVRVDGTLHVNAEAAGVNVNAGAVSVGAVDVARPLDCSRAPRARAYVDALRDDPNGGWSEVWFGRGPTNKVTQPSELSLGCGRYVMPSLEVANTLRIRVSGDVVLVVDGTLRVASPMVIDLDSDATLALVIRDSLEVDNTLSIAEGRDPARTWVNIGDRLRVASPLKLNGTLVMPDGELAGDNTFDLQGQALVGSARIAAPMVVRLDAARDALACAP